MEKDKFLNKMKNIYADNGKVTEASSRCSATPAQIARVINPKDMNDGLKTNPPTEKDIKEKGDG